MPVQPTADVSLNGISVPVRPGLADSTGKRGPAVLSVTMRVELDAVDLAAAMLTYLDHEYGEYADLVGDKDAWRTVANYIVGDGLNATWTAYRDAMTAKAPSVCLPSCARLGGDDHDRDCTVGWCLTRARRLLNGTGPIPLVPADDGLVPLARTGPREGHALDVADPVRSLCAIQGVSR